MAGTLVTLASTAGFMSFQVVTTAAAYIDSADVISGSLQAYSVPRPALSCDSGGSELLLSWPAASKSGVAYSATVDGNPATVQSNGTSRFIRLTGSLLGVAGTRYTIAVWAHIGSWQSVIAKQNVRDSGVLVLLITPECDGSPY